MSSEALAKRLKQELLVRTKRNPKYSLRAFARQLDIEASLLSKILRGQRKAGPKIKAKIAAALGTQKLPLNSEKVEYLNEDQFQMISDWYHYAILELLMIKGFSKKPHSISKALGISLVEAKDACDRLLRLGYIKAGASGEYISLKKKFSTFSTPDTNAAFRNLQRGVLEKALQALDEIPVRERDQTSMTMAVDPKILPKAKEKITKFRREFCKWLESQGQPSEVYHLSLSIYPVSKVNLYKYKLKGEKK